MRKIVAPKNMSAPASDYNHGLLVSSESRILYLSGQLGEYPDDSFSPDLDAQAMQAWNNIKILLAGADMSVSNIVKVISYLVGREHIPNYVTWHKMDVVQAKPSWTLLLVDGLGGPDYQSEIDVIASK